MKNLLLYKNVRILIFVLTALVCSGCTVGKTDLPREIVVIESKNTAEEYTDEIENEFYEESIKASEDMLIPQISRSESNVSSVSYEVSSKYNGDSTQYNDETIEMYVTDAGVRFRAEPSLEAKIYQVLQTGQKVILFSENEGWGFVSLEGIDGYVSMQFLAKTEQKNENNSSDKLEIYPEKDITDADIKPDIGKKGKIVAIDAGHQKKGNSEQEAIGPGASERKAKVASGTTGVSTKIPEYQLTLDVSLKLRDELDSRGYDVYMIRETNDVDISNRERAVLANEAGAEVLIRIHANGSADSAANGILTISPTAKNPYISNIYKECRRLSDCVLSETLKSTNAKNKGVWETDTMSGINWSPIPVTIVEMGFMSNPEEDKLMQTESYQDKLVQGIANGIDIFFQE